MSLFAFAAKDPITQDIGTQVRWEDEAPPSPFSTISYGISRLRVPYATEPEDHLSNDYFANRGLIIPESKTSPLPVSAPTVVDDVQSDLHRKYLGFMSTQGHIPDHRPSPDIPPRVNATHQFNNVPESQSPHRSQIMDLKRLLEELESTKEMYEYKARTQESHIIRCLNDAVEAFVKFLRFKHLKAETTSNMKSVIAHLRNYGEPVRAEMSFASLNGPVYQPHLASTIDNPDKAAEMIPYLETLIRYARLHPSQLPERVLFSGFIGTRSEESEIQGPASDSSELDYHWIRD